MQYASILFRNFVGDSPMENLSGFALEAKEMALVLQLGRPLAELPPGTPRHFVCVDEFGKGTEDRHATSMAAACIKRFDQVRAHSTCTLLSCTVDPLVLATALNMAMLCCYGFFAWRAPVYEAVAIVAQVPCRSHICTATCRTMITKHCEICSRPRFPEQRYFQRNLVFWQVAQSTPGSSTRLLTVLD